MTSGSNSQWLADYIADAVARNVCTRLNCTTCGALEFRTAIRQRATAILAGATQSKKSEMHSVIAEALSRIPRPKCHLDEYEHAVRCLIYDLWCSTLPLLFDRDIAPQLAGTWSGQVLASMQAHEKRVQQLRAEHEARNDPAVIAKIREQKRLAKKKEMAGRKERKKEIDRIWRQQQERK